MSHRMSLEPPTVATPRVVDGIDELIGNTPLLRIPVENGAPGVRVLGKLEAANPLSSVKDRTALWMLRAAEESGRLAPGGTVIEATSGNTGIALAALCAARGYRCVIVLPDSVTRERVALLEALGAEVVLTPRELLYQGAIDRAWELHQRTRGSWFARQHENAANVAAHRESTGPEVWADTGGRVDVFLAGIGTGGTLCGTAGYLKERDPGVRAIGVEPASSPLLTRGRAGEHAIPGLNGGFVAPTTDVGLIDEVLVVSDEDALATARWLAARVGVLAGISSGAAVCGALSVARRPQSAGRTIVTVLPDTGERYLSIWSQAAGDPGAGRTEGEGR